MIVIDAETVASRLASAREEYRLNALEIQRLEDYGRRINLLIHVLEDAGELADRWRSYLTLDVCQCPTAEGGAT